MQLTHHLKMWTRDHDCANIECLCDRDSGVLIISNTLIRRKGERWFIDFLNLHDHKIEELKGFSRDGVCYYERKELN